ncbi:hydroxymethylglutaryl-CoA lyase [candidate division KSB1 bacterium]|nr:hydroxymethylglutaryl-CoA lyase [candidate division KSB1 bacterium]
MQTVKHNINIHEVGLRDGLQIEKQLVPFEKKMGWINRLFASGIKKIQLGSFVHPVKVPQMSDTDRLFTDVLKSGKKPENVILSGLVLNEKGLDRGLACGVEMFCMGVSASNTHSVKNTGMSTTEALGRIITMAKRAVSESKRVQVSVQSAFGCGYEGLISKNQVIDIVKSYLDAGLLTISLADTAGYAFPEQVTDLFGAIIELDNNIEPACHFHDTFGTGIANCFTAYQAGVTCFESAFGGLGGCPFTRISSGNVCTEDLVYLFMRQGLADLPDLEKLIELTRDIGQHLGRELSGRLYKTGLPNILKGF